MIQSVTQNKANNILRFHLMFKLLSCSGDIRLWGLQRWTHFLHIKRSSTVNWNPTNDISCRHGCRRWSPQRVYVCDCTWADICILDLCSLGLWMSLPGDPEDCSKCVSVSLINSNTGAFGTCGQVNETQWEGTFPWFPPHQEAAGDGMRFSNSVPRSLRRSPNTPHPTHQRDSLIPSLGAKAPPPSHLCFSVTYWWLLPSQFIFLIIR